MSATLSDASASLETVFGFRNFREGQEPVVTRLLDGRSVLAIFPTGGGKSLCYQLPALLFEGLTLVISPLIALMKDQIDFLISRGVAAARLDSSVPLDEWRQIHRDLSDNKIKLLYVAPERLANERFLQTLARLPLSMMAVDEAHCISEWGHNFRPDYMKLSALAKQLAVPRVLALTATATPAVAKNIAAAFGIADEDVVQTGFYRSNLSLRITPAPAEERDAILLDQLRSAPRGPTIVYVTLQKTADRVSAALAEAGLPAASYHAGLDAEQRHDVQDWFMASADAIVVATIAFGMGIDKRDIRYVYHYNLPKSLENYAQEIGRSGRDGLPSMCEMLACGDDAVTLENFTFGDTPPSEAVHALTDHLLDRREDRFDISTYELSGDFDVRPLVIETLLTYLELDGVLQSTGPFYTEYKFQPLRSSAEMLEKFDPRRQAFLRKILSRAKKAKVWFSINLDDAAAACGEPREKVVAALNYLEEQGDLKLQVAGARHGYRILKKEADPQALAAVMNERFHKREARDVERMKSVLDFAVSEGCLTNRLVSYFGEERPTPCGHCGGCLGQQPGPLPTSPIKPLGDPEAAEVRTLRAQHAAALASARQMAKFLCGISSPGLTRAKLSRHPLFGSWAGVPFQSVVAFVETQMG